MTPRGTLEFVRKHPRINLELLAEFTIADPDQKEGLKKESALIKVVWSKNSNALFYKDFSLIYFSHYP